VFEIRVLLHSNTGTHKYKVNLTKHQERSAVSVCDVVRYAMKCLDKKRIKLKGGETLALNERIMLSLVSTEVTVLSADL